LVETINVEEKAFDFHLFFLEDVETKGLWESYRFWFANINISQLTGCH
jgi:hypothetical protein